MPTRTPQLFPRRCWTLRSDRRGFVFVFFAVALPALLAIVGLALDLGRLATLDTQLANIADAAALAAASQLDRSDAAMEKARSAAEALTNTSSFADAGTARVSLSFRFAETLADLRGSPTFTLADASAARAVYVEVTTAERSLTASFAQLVGAGTTSIRRSATGESQYFACDVTPMVMCQRDPDGFEATARRGRQYRFSNTGGMSDGSLLLVDAPGNAGGRGAVVNLASDAPKFCYIDGVALRGGTTEREFDDAINVRFDRFVNARGPIAAELAAFAPAPNIIQGQRFSSCSSPPNAADINPPYRLPRDTAYKTVRTGGAAYDLGRGDWKQTTAYGQSGSATVRTALDEYIAWNHASKSEQFQGDLRTAETRYEIYLKELGLQLATDKELLSRQQIASGGPPPTMPTGGPTEGSFRSLRENTVPQCYRGPSQSYQARRRILYLAIADCANFPDAAVATKLSKTVGKFFLTEAAQDGTVYLEFINMVRPHQDDGKLRRVVQLVETR